MRVRKIWDIKTTEPNENILKLCGYNRILAVLLLNRGINTEEKINNFLNPLKTHLSSPEVFTDMDKSVQRIKQAIDNNENITIYGDFDADGITSTSILYLTLKELGANVSYYLPDRMTESHGLNTKALVNIISKRKSKLIITVDCGISNKDEVNFAKGFKADVIITDHHEAPEILPDAFAIINPKAPDSLKQDLSLEELESLNYLSGAGVAFKLACALLNHFKKEDFVYKILSLAAIGTIGDVVELLGENRTIAAMGIELIKKGLHKGISQLLLSAGVNDFEAVTSETIAFTIVPRLNAAGRLDNPISAINLLISDDEEQINTSAKILNELNQKRQDLCNEVYNEAKSMYLAKPNENKKSIILYSPSWHLGIIGIAASKLVEEFNKPVFLMTSDENNPDIIRCSSRSIQGVNIHSILSEHKNLYEGFGGHKMAAGFSFDKTKISFDKFKLILAETIDEYTQDVDFTTAKIEADMELQTDDLTFETIETINKLRPFGQANPAPLFVIKDMCLENFRLMGQNNNHLKLFLSKNNSKPIECVKWNYPDFNLPLNSKIDILFSPSVNIFNGESNIQLIISDLKSELLDKQEQQNEIKILDHRNKKNIIMQVLDFINTTKKRTGIFIENSALKTQLNLPNTIENKLFTSENIPSDTEQIMFFDCPNCESEFNKIIKDSNAKIVHLMNFNISVINTDNVIIKLSGMLKYALSNLNGEINLLKLANALYIDIETLDCILNLFDNCNLTDYNKTNENTATITYIHPVELSKIKQDDLYYTADEKIKEINNFRRFYLQSTTDEIKELIQG